MSRFRVRYASARVLAVIAVILAASTIVPRTQELLATTTNEINTTGYEDSPFLSADGQSFYFMYTPWSIWPVFFGRPPYLAGPDRQGHHINRDRNPWEDTDIYVSTQQRNGSWSTPRNLGFNDDQADCCAMTWDGALFAFQRTQRPATALTDIYFVKLVGNKWLRTAAGPNVNGVDSSESNPHLSADGAALFFSSNRADGFGGHDLFVSYRQEDGSWGPATNLGPTFNTPANEDQIWVSRDGGTIYFNREPGPTIMASMRDGSGAWSAPTVVRFGSKVPQAAEVSVTDDGFTIVFAEVRPDVEDIVFMKSHRLADGNWGTPSPFRAR